MLHYFQRVCLVLSSLFVHSFTFCLLSTQLEEERHLWLRLLFVPLFWYIGAYLKLNDPTKPGVLAGPGGKAAIAMMYIWIASFILAWSGGPFVVGSEVFDQNIRSFVQAINAAMSWVPIFIMSRFTTNMIRAMDYGIYFFFAALAVATIHFFFCQKQKVLPWKIWIDYLVQNYLPGEHMIFL